MKCRNLDFRWEFGGGGSKMATRVHLFSSLRTFVCEWIASALPIVLMSVSCTYAESRGSYGGNCAGSRMRWTWRKSARGLYEMGRCKKSIGFSSENPSLFCSERPILSSKNGFFSVHKMYAKLQSVKSAIFDENLGVGVQKWQTELHLFSYLCLFVY